MLPQKIIEYSKEMSVMCVEDDAKTREQMATLLEVFFEDVRIFEDGAAGLEAYQTYKMEHDRFVDVIISDIKMPKLDGIAMSREILKLHPDQVIIILSAYNDSENLMKLINVGIHYFILKPLQSENLYPTLYDAVHHLHQIRLNERHAAEREVLNTRLNRAVSDLFEALDSAERASRGRDAFLTNMSHEVHTPMNAIVGMTHLLKKSKLNETQQEYLWNLTEATAQLSDIIDNALNLSELESGLFANLSVSFAVDDLLQALAEPFMNRALHKGLELTFSVDRRLPSQFYGDRKHLEQVLRCLLSNALKFTHKGSVCLKIAPMDDGVIGFSVIDSGIGMTEAQIADLFKPFDPLSMQQRSGPGLGLAVSHRLVELMGGTLRVFSQPDKGSEFQLLLTFRAEETPLPSHLPEGLRMLIAEPGMQSGAALEQVLLHFGYTVHWVQDEAAYRAAEAYDVAFVAPMFRRAAVQGGKTIRLHTGETCVDPNPGDICLRKPFTRTTVQNALLHACSPMPPRADDLSTLRGSRILLAEDHAINRKVISGLLEGSGITLVTAENGREAVEILEKEGDFDLILMDVNMPEMDGYEATRRIRQIERFKSLPILALTANTTDEDVRTALEAGMQVHLSKPVDVKRLFAELLKWIEPKAKSASDVSAAEPIDVEGELAALPLIDVLQGLQGLQRVGGNKTLYRRILIDFARDFREAAPLIALMRKEGRMEAAAGLLHNIKGTAGNLGAMNLFEAADAFKTALQKEASDVEARRRAFESALDAVITSITVLDVGPDTTTRPPIEPEQLRCLLEEIQELAAHRRPCKTVIEQLESYRWPDAHHDALHQIISTAQRYRFRETLIAIDALLQQLEA